MAHANDCPRKGVQGKRAKIKCTCGDTDRKRKASAVQSRFEAEHPEPDTCDGCGAEMRYDRINVRVFYACEDCTDAAMRALGNTHDHVVLGMAR